MKENSTMLKVSSIIFLIFGIMTAAFTLLKIAGASFFGALGGRGLALFAGSLVAFLSIASIALALFRIVIGAMGLSAVSGNVHPSACRVLGFILLAIHILGSFFTFFTHQLDGSALVSALINLALIGCYIKGANDMLQK